MDAGAFVGIGGNTAMGCDITGAPEVAVIFSFAGVCARRFNTFIENADFGCIVAAQFTGCTASRLGV